MHNVKKNLYSGYKCDKTNKIAAVQTLSVTISSTAPNCEPIIIK